jgi:hypothetical protein
MFHGTDGGSTVLGLVLSKHEFCNAKVTKLARVLVVQAVINHLTRMQIQ